MALQIGDTAPDFEAETTEGRIRFHDWLGNSWGVLRLANVIRPPCVIIHGIDGRGPSGHRLAPANSETQGCDTRELEDWRGRDHRRIGVG